LSTSAWIDCGVQADMAHHRDLGVEDSQCTEVEAAATTFELHAPLRPGGGTSRAAFATVFRRFGLDRG